MSLHHGKEGVMAERGSGRREGLLWRVLAVLFSVGFLGLGMTAIGAGGTTAPVSATRVGGGSYEVTWDVPKLQVGFPDSPYVAVDVKPFDLDKSRSFPLRIPIPTIPGWMRDLVEQAQKGLSVFPCTVPDWFTMDFDFSTSAEISVGASFSVEVHPPTVDPGELHVEATVSASVGAWAEAARAAAVARGEAWAGVAARGETVPLIATARLEPKLLRFSDGGVEGGQMSIAGHLSASAKATLLGVDLPVPSLPKSSFAYSLPEDEGEKTELFGTGISVGLYSVPLPEARDQSLWKVADKQGPLYEIEADLDKLMLILIGKFSGSGEAKVAANGFLEAFDDGLGVTLKSGSDELELHFLDDELSFVVDVEREATVRPDFVELVYQFSAPVEVNGESVTSLTVEGTTRLSLRAAKGEFRCETVDLGFTQVRRCYWDRSAPFTIVHDVDIDPASITIPLGCQAERITVTPTMKIELSAQQALKLVGAVKLQRRAGVVYARVGSRFICGPWDSCIWYPAPCSKKVCDPTGIVDAGCNLIGADCNDCFTVWYPCLKRLSLPPLVLPPITLGPYKVYGWTPINKPLDISPGLSRADNVTFTLQLDDFEIPIADPIAPTELVEVSISTSNPSGQFCTIGDDVTVTFTASDKWTGLPKVEIGRCDADVTYQGSNRYVATCVMDDSTREGEIEFEIRGEDRFGNPVVGTETTDGSEAIFDSEPPDFDDCPEDVTTADPEADWDEPTAWDNGSGVASVTKTHDPGDSFPVGTTTVIYTATDNAWNTATCEFDVTVLDDEPPIFDDCPDDIYIATSTDSAVVSWDEPTAYDDGSGIGSVTQTHHPGDTFPLGTTTVTYTATDNAGNTATCEFDVTVIDDEPPGFDDCPGDIWEGTSTTSAVVSWTEPTAYDDGSGIASVTQTHYTGDTFPLGTTTVTYTATDHAGNTATCEFDVTVEELL